MTYFSVERTRKSSASATSSADPIRPSTVRAALDAKIGDLLSALDQLDGDHDGDRDDDDDHDDDDDRDEEDDDDDEHHSDDDRDGEHGDREGGD